MATGGLGDFSDMKKAVKDVEHTSSKSQTSHTTIELKLLLWNIHGDTSAGMADARQMLVQKVYHECNPDIFLLQEVITASKWLPKPSKNYPFCHSALKTEAYVVYVSPLFDSVMEIDIPAIIGKERLLSDEAAPSTRSAEHSSADQKFYNNHSCAIRLRHRTTGKELILMSFHNVSNRTGGHKNVISCAKGFITLVCLVHEHEKVPVIAGGDFNCDRSDLQDYAKAKDCELPGYYSSERRRLNDTIDLYVLKSSSSIRSTVKVFEALPLVDHTSAEAHAHPLGRETIQHLVENAPVNKNTNKKLTMDDYTRTTNHDPTLCTIEVEY